MTGWLALVLLGLVVSARTRLSAVVAGQPVSVPVLWLVFAAVVVAVAGVAAYVSYWHAVEVVTRHAEPGVIGHLYPVLIDGIVVAASMVLLDSARHSEPAPPLAWWMLGAGVAVTLAANITFGAQAGPASALWAAWPAAAFVGCYETVMLLVRASARRTEIVPRELIPPAVPSSAELAAEASLRATLAVGNRGRSTSSPSGSR